MSHRASCCCGQLSVVVEGELPKTSICHCFQCQRRTGSAFGLQAKFPKERVTVEGNATKFVRSGEGEVVFNFCPQCASTVFWELSGLPGMVVVAVGMFAKPDFPAPTFSVYEARMHSWVELPESISTHWD